MPESCEEIYQRKPSSLTERFQPETNVWSQTKADCVHQLQLWNPLSLNDTSAKSETNSDPHIKATFSEASSLLTTRATLMLPTLPAKPNSLPF